LQVLEAITSEDRVTRVTHGEMTVETVAGLLLGFDYGEITTFAQNLPDHLKNCALRWPGWSRACPPGARGSTQAQKYGWCGLIYSKPAQLALSFLKVLGNVNLTLVEDEPSLALSGDNVDKSEMLLGPSEPCGT
jgi:hypothetical protein